MWTRNRMHAGRVPTVRFHRMDPEQLSKFVTSIQGSNIVQLRMSLGGPSEVIRNHVHTLQGLGRWVSLLRWQFVSCCQPAANVCGESELAVNESTSLGSYKLTH